MNSSCTTHDSTQIRQNSFFLLQEMEEEKEEDEEEEKEYNVEYIEVRF